MKKNLLLLLALIFIVQFSLANHVSADAPTLKPLLSGKMIHFSSGVIYPKFTNNKITDNNAATYQSLADFMYDNSFGWYEFEKSVTIDAYKLLSVNNAEIRFYDLSGNLIYAMNKNTNAMDFTGAITTITPIKGVKKVALRNISTTSDTKVQEFNVYSQNANEIVPPGEVSNLSENHTDSTVSFTWTRPADLDFSHVSIYRDNFKVGESLGTTFTDQHLDTGTTYSYNVVTVDKLGNTSTGTPILVTTATPNGYMDGKEVFLGTSATEAASSTFNVTDNISTTVKTIANSVPSGQTTHNWAWYNFETPTTIGAYKLATNLPTALWLNYVHLFFYDSNGNLLYDSGSHNGTEVNGIITSIPPVSNVSKVAVRNDTSSSFQLREFNVYEAMNSSIEPPKKVQNVAASYLLSDSRIHVEWDVLTAENILYYTIHILKNGIETVSLMDSRYVNAFFLIDNSEGTVYTLRVGAVTKDGSESISDPVTISKLYNIVPTEVSNLSETHLDRSATLHFDLPSSPYLSHAVIYRNGVEVGKVYPGTTAFTDKWLLPENSYEYTMRTFYISGVRSLGTGISLTTLPDIFAPSEVSNTSHQLLVNDDYRVVYALPPEPDFSHVNVYENGILVGTSVGGFFDVGEILRGVTKTYEIKTVDELGHESAGVTYNMTTPVDLDAPGEVVYISHTVTDFVYSLHFENPADRDFIAVRIYAGETLIGETGSGNVNLGELENNNTFTYRLTTLDRYGNESSGVMHSIVTPDTLPPDEVTELTYAVDFGSYSLTYELPSNIDFDAINVYRDGTLIGTTVDNTFHIGELSSGEYHFTVKTVDNLGNESPGISVDITV